MRASKVNPVCEECKKLSPEKHRECTHPCSHLVSWASHINTQEFIRLFNQPFVTEEQECSEAWRRLAKRGLWTE